MNYNEFFNVLATELYPLIRGGGRRMADVFTLDTPRLSSITTLLAAADQADPASLNRLFSLLYGELRTMAHGKLFQAGQLTSVDTTGLVHESYIRFLKAGQLKLTDKSQFLAYAAQVMRSIIVDAVRDRQTARSGGEVTLIPLDTGISEAAADAAATPEMEILHIHEALTGLATLDASLAQLVELRYFGGLSVSEIAELTNQSERTIQRNWEKARLYLFHALNSP